MAGAEQAGAGGNGSRCEPGSEVEQGVEGIIHNVAPDCRPSHLGLRVYRILTNLIPPRGSRRDDTA
jgi:hypothetical protein